MNRNDLISTARSSAEDAQPALETVIAGQKLSERVRFLWEAMADVVLDHVVVALLPPGGGAGEVLTKVGAANYAVEWAPASGGGGDWLTSGYTGTPGRVAAFNGSGNASFVNLAAVATSGAYADLTGTPSLALVATSGEYSDLLGTPTLASVATSGAYADLTGTPTLASVATSGAYADLTGTPTLITGPGSSVNGGIVVWDGADGTALESVPWVIDADTLTVGANSVVVQSTLGQNSATGTLAAVLGGFQAVATVGGSRALAGGAFRATPGNAQFQEVVLTGTTTGSGDTAILTFGASSTPSANNQILLEERSAYVLRIMLVAKRVAGSVSRCWSVEWAVRRFTSGPISGGTPVETSSFVMGLTSGGYTLGFDAALSSIQIEVQHDSLSTNIEWVAHVSMVKVHG